VTNHFADTTALFEYHAGTRETRGKARSLLRPREQVATSEHVRREWKRILFHAARAFLEAVENEPDLSAVLRRMGFGYGREASQRWMAAALLCAGSDNLGIADIKIRCRRLLRGDIDRILQGSIGTLREASACGLARQEPTQGRDGRWQLKDTCKRREGICNHEQRLGRDMGRWRTAASALSVSEDASLRRMGKVATEMADDAVRRTGVNCYGKTGDIAIALDCSSKERLVTTDKSFMQLGDRMGFRVVLIAPPTVVAGPPKG
jgi:hypothetical protein